MAHSIYILDKDSNAVNALALDIGGGALTTQPIWGAIAGWKGLSYTPSGAMIDAVPQDSVQVPLDNWLNLGVGIGAQLLVWDDTLGAEATRGPIIAIDDAVDEFDVHWATVTFADLLYDLVRADVTSSFASDIGYTNHGVGDPVPTRAAETLAQTTNRLVSLADTVWVGVSDVTGLDGIAFASTGSVVQGLDKLRQERFCHFRRELANGTPRTLRLSNYGTPFIANGLPVWLGAPPPDPTSATYVAQVPMHQPHFIRKAPGYNSITPTGAGNGTSQLTLRVLYGVVFDGYQPAHSIQRRPTESGATSDGFDYFIEDLASIATYGRSRGPCAIPGIGVTVSPAGTTAPVDETAAAISLYVAAVASLHRSAVPVTQLTFTTPALGDIRNVGGMLVHVKYEGWAFDDSRQAHQFLNVDDDYFVNGVVRAEDDAGVVMDTWTVTTNGEAIASAGGTLLGVMDTVTALHAAVQTYPISRPRPKSQNIGPGADLTIEIFADNSMVRRHWALMYLTLEGMVHTRADNGHTQDVITQGMNHDVNAIPHDITEPTIHFKVGGGDQEGNTLVYEPATQFLISKSPPASAVPVMLDQKTGFLYANITVNNVAIPVGIEVLQAFVKASSGGTGGTVKQTTGANAPGSGPIGGTVPATTHPKATGYGAQLAVATQESVYRGPLPTGVTVWVDNVQRFGPFNTSPGVLDLTPYVSDQNGHTVAVKSPTNGAADVFIDVRDDVAAIAVRPTG